MHACQAGMNSFTRQLEVSNRKVNHRNASSNRDSARPTQTQCTDFEALHEIV